MATTLWRRYMFGKEGSHLVQATITPLHLSCRWHVEWRARSGDYDFRQHEESVDRRNCTYAVIRLRYAYASVEAPQLKHALILCFCRSMRVSFFGCVFVALTAVVRDGSATLLLRHCAGK